MKKDIVFSLGDLSGFEWGHTSGNAPDDDTGVLLKKNPFSYKSEVTCA